MCIDFLPTSWHTGAHAHQRGRPGATTAWRPSSSACCARCGLRPLRRRHPGLDFAVCAPGAGRVRDRPGFDLHVEHGLGPRPTTADLVAVPAERRRSSRRPTRSLDTLAAALRPRRPDPVALHRRLRPRRGRAARRPLAAPRTGGTPTSWPRRFPRAKVDARGALRRRRTGASPAPAPPPGIDACLHLWRQEFGAARRGHRRPPDGGAAAARRRPGAVHRPPGARLRRRDARPAAGLDRPRTSARSSRRVAGPAPPACRRAPSPGGSAPRPAPPRTPGSPASGCCAAEELLERTDQLGGLDRRARSASATPPTLRHHFTGPAAVSPQQYRRTFSPLDSRRAG